MWVQKQLYLTNPNCPLSLRFPFYHVSNGMVYTLLNKQLGNLYMQVVHYVHVYKEPKWLYFIFIEKNILHISVICPVSDVP